MGSGQWAVGSGQWAWAVGVGSGRGQRACAREPHPRLPRINRTGRVGRISRIGGGQIHERRRRWRLGCPRVVPELSTKLAKVVVAAREQRALLTDREAAGAVVCMFVRVHGRL